MSPSRMLSDVEFLARDRVAVDRTLRPEVSRPEGGRRTGHVPQIRGALEIAAFVLEMGDQLSVLVPVPLDVPQSGIFRDVLPSNGDIKNDRILDRKRLHRDQPSNLEIG